MNEEQIGTAIEGIERGLWRDDPAFLRRFRAVRRAEIRTVVSVIMLLATGSVLLTVGLAAPSWPIWGAGLLTFALSFLVDERHKQAVRRSS
jgi:hypothetical protein